MFDKSLNRFIVSESMCHTTAEMLLFNMCAEMIDIKSLTASKSTQNKQKSIGATISPTDKVAPTIANKRGRKAVGKSG